MKTRRPVCFVVGIAMTLSFAGASAGAVEIRADESVPGSSTNRGAKLGFRYYEKYTSSQYLSDSGSRCLAWRFNKQSATNRKSTERLPCGSGGPAMLAGLRIGLPKASAHLRLPRGTYGNIRRAKGVRVNHSRGRMYKEAVRAKVPRPNKNSKIAKKNRNKIYRVYQIWWRRAGYKPRIYRYGITKQKSHDRLNKGKRRCKRFVHDVRKCHGRYIRRNVHGWYRARQVEMGYIARYAIRNDGLFPPGNPNGT